MFYLGVDTGGTFTDFVLFDRTNAAIVTFKIASTPADPGAAVETGLERLARDHGVTGDNLERFVFGTTVATNAVLEGRGAPTALIATRGTRDVLEIQRQWRHRLFDLYLTKPKPLVPRRYRLELNERIDAKGNVLTPLSAPNLDETIDALTQLPVEAVAVSLLFSFLRPEHEQLTAAAIRERLPHLNVTVSSDICPEFREYERTATTVMNAYTMPKIRALVERLDSALRNFDFKGAFSVFQSNGGVMSIEKARTHPVNTLLSGPAAGVVAAAGIGRLAKIDRLIAFDVGGTSTDISLVEGGAVGLSAQGGISGYPVKVPQVRVHTIGAGGGSIARPELELLKVGPQSAGALPGPAAYGRGGTEPTSTDAAIVLGYIDPDHFFGGEITLDAGAARRAIEENVARPLNLDVDSAALAILKVQVAHIVAGIRAVSVETGKDPRNFTLMPFGGAGGLFAGAVAEEADIGRILLPPHASVLSALGMLMTDIRHDRARTHLMPLADADHESLSAIFDDLTEEANAQMAVENIANDQVRQEFSCDMRYEGQAYEINVRVENRSKIEPATLRTAFDSAHERLYGQGSPNEPVEIVSFRVGVIGRVDHVALPPIDANARTEPSRHRPVLFSADDGWIDCPVYDRSGLGAGAEIIGPAIFEDPGTSIPIMPGYTARVDDIGSVLIDTGVGEHPPGTDRELERAQ